MARPSPDTLIEPSPAAVQKAAEWLAHLESGDADEADMAAFEAWRGHHPAHALAFQRMGGLGTKLETGSAIERETLRRLFLRPGSKAGAAVAALLIMAVSGWFVARLPSVRIAWADERTAPGESRAVALADGSRLVLATGSAADLDVGGGHRTIRLLQGEVLAEVAKGRGTPFVIETDDGITQALGTAFSVRREASGTIVAVVESHVRVCATGRSDGCRTLGPGERVRIAGGVVAALPRLAPADIAAWSEGWLPVDDRPLVDVLQEMNRWRAHPIRFDRQALGGLRVSGMFPLRDTDRAIANLAGLLPVVVEDPASESPLVRRR